MPYPGYCMVWLLCLFKYAIIYSCCCLNLSNFAVFCKKIFYLPYIPSSLILNKRHLSFSAMLPYPPKPSIFPRVWCSTWQQIKPNKTHHWESYTFLTMARVNKIRHYGRCFLTCNSAKLKSWLNFFPIQRNTPRYEKWVKQTI